MTEMKTAATVLQEMMVKMGQIPEYECISQSGPQHQAMFEYRCKAQGLEVTASARCKKDAKQEVAKRMLRRLAAAGYAVPRPYGLDCAAAQATQSGPASGDKVEPASTGSRSYVALLKELCAEYRLPGADYDLVSDTGPAHLRHFTLRARVGQHARDATSTTKKAARQLAAEKLYCYLRENLARITKDFDEADALARAHERVMERYLESADDAARRPDLGQKVADYHRGLQTHLDPAVLAGGRAAVAATGRGSPERELEAAAAALGLELRYSALQRQGGGQLCVLALEPAAPALVLAGRDRREAADSALRYLRLTL